MKLRYSILIQWSDENQKYVVSLPEFSPYSHTHGNTYEEATKNAQDVLKLLIETYEEQNRPLPEPATLQCA